MRFANNAVYTIWIPDVVVKVSVNSVNSVRVSAGVRLGGAGWPSGLPRVPGVVVPVRRGDFDRL